MFTFNHKLEGYYDKGRIIVFIMLCAIVGHFSVADASTPIAPTLDIESVYNDTYPVTAKASHDERLVFATAPTHNIDNLIQYGVTGGYLSSDHDPVDIEVYGELGCSDTCHLRSAVPPDLATDYTVDYTPSYDVYVSYEEETMSYYLTFRLTIPLSSHELDGDLYTSVGLLRLETLEPT